MSAGCKSRKHMCWPSLADPPEMQQLATPKPEPSESAANRRNSSSEHNRCLTQSRQTAITALSPWLAHSQSKNVLEPACALARRSFTHTGRQVSYSLVQNITKLRVSLPTPTLCAQVACRRAAHPPAGGRLIRQHPSVSSSIGWRHDVPVVGDHVERCNLTPVLSLIRFITPTPR